ncbi:MAG: bifunctional pyr operon transcriptional regulator/uracil phosphoribosyltransferase PyrR [Actinobacteria bacterium]|nr:MAG: bifunctional pyr operon transcriptional regulator/uracil phosphoribosyltransferase PyrR [Actinomycetota bacterium]
MSKSLLLNEEQLDRALTRISHEILERNSGAKNIVLIGLQSRGVFLAKRLASKIINIEKIEVPVGSLDIGLYRDDISTGGAKELKKTEIGFDITDKSVVLVDDVLFTGRTIRAAMDALIDYGRPSQVQLAVLVDRGHRELPIRPDYIGKNIPTSLAQKVEVKLKEENNEDSVYLGEDA